MKISMLMSVSLNGYIARENGEEDFLLEENWETMKSYVKEYGNLVWGRKTYETVLTWGEEYRKYLESIPLVVVSTKRTVFPKEKLTYCQSPKEAIQYLQTKGYENILVSGGAKLNTAFLNQGLVDELILSYNPVLIPKGINLFTSYLKETVLELIEMKKIKENIIYARYKIRR